MADASSTSATCVAKRRYRARRVNLRRAAQRIRVLDLRGVIQVRTDDHRVGQQGQEVRRANQLTGVRAQGVDLGEEDLVGAAQCLDRHRGRDVHELHERLTVGERENQLSEHPVRAVDEGQSSFSARTTG